MIAIGDFFQLPPCNSEEHWPMFAFDLDAWHDAINHYVHLSVTYCQVEDDMASLSPMVYA